MTGEDKLVEMMRDYPNMPLRDVVFQTLRKGIFRGDLQPGERLMEIRMANRLGVSRTPVREAIRMLELEGLVVNTPRRGAQVAQITQKDLSDVLEVREGLEEMAVRLACQRISDEEVDALYEASRFFEKTVENENVIELAEADENFHSIIYQASRNDKLVQLISNLREQMYRYRVEYLKEKESWQSLIDEHDEMWKNIRERNVDAAVATMKHHIDRQREHIWDKLK